MAFAKSLRRRSVAISLISCIGALPQAALRRPRAAWLVRWNVRINTRSAMPKNAM